MSFKEDIGKKWLCPLPFMHTTMRQGGVYATCCEAWRTKIKIDEVSPIEFFNSEHSQDLRKAFLTDQPQNEPIVQNVCRKCIGAEESFGYSKRTRDSKELKLDNYKYLEKNYSIAQKDINHHIEPYMDFIKIECGNTCNLKCIMCVPSSSSLIGGYVYDPDFTDEVYKDLEYTYYTIQVKGPQNRLICFESIYEIDEINKTYNKVSIDSTPYSMVQGCSSKDPSIYSLSNIKNISGDLVFSANEDLSNNQYIYFEDCGYDQTCSVDEYGYSIKNKDPSHDDYPRGKENNNLFDCEHFDCGNDKICPPSFYSKYRINILVFIS